MRILGSLLTLVLAAALASSAVLPARGQTAPVDDVVWLCRPAASDDPCRAPLTAAVVENDRVVRTETATPAPDPGIDCFYVYPTVSRETTANSDLVVHEAERDVATNQASRFSQVCRVWAPMYRSVTLAHLFASRPAGGVDPFRVAYESVAAAWHAYLATENHGRPFVLIGHSQGALMLTTLIEREIDGDPALRGRLVSAILLGGNVLEATAPGGKATFRHIAPCATATQVHCLIAYSSFDRPPDAKAFFGIAEADDDGKRTPLAGSRVVCTNPAALGGGAAPLHAYLPNDGKTGRPDAMPDVPWLAYPATFTAQCTTAGDATYLAIARTAPAASTLPHVAAYPSPGWGLHVFDVNIALGDLVDVVRAQAPGALRASR
jgi:hypothetical protein